MLQTPEYARAVIGADDRLDDELIEARVRFRLERQENVFASLQPPDTTIILGQGAVSLVVGSHDILDAQLAHLHRIAATHQAKIRILPFAAGAYPKRGSFALLEFASTEDPATAYVDVPLGARYFDRPPELAEYEYVYGVVEGLSVPIEEWTA